MTTRATRNRTIHVEPDEVERLRCDLMELNEMVPAPDVLGRVICQDIRSTAKHLPSTFVDLLFLDPPYNLNKSFNGRRFSRQSAGEYRRLLDEWILPILHTLKPTASVYICSDWWTSGEVQSFAQEHFHVRNRITWEREKGRGAKSNWKNCSEDIWYCTVSDEFVFNIDAVKLKRMVIAPYTTDDGTPKDWSREEAGDFRLTHPSNIWTDLTIPFWSMPENTDHPTQKPEKLLAKVILASSQSGDVILDPFLGSGTTAVVAKKLERSFVGVDIDEDYCCLALKRLEMAESDCSIQGYADGVFWERNTSVARSRLKQRSLKGSRRIQERSLFVG